MKKTQVPIIHIHEMLTVCLFALSISSVCMQLSPSHLRFSYIYHTLYPRDFCVHFPRMTFSYITTVKLPSSLDMLSSLHQLPIFQFHQLKCAS